jgi:hypothetical protein
LEYDCILAARKAQRFRLQNTQTPTEPHIPEPMLAELRDNFGTIQTLLSMLGFPTLDPLTQEDSSGERRQRLYCRGSGAEATGEYTEDGLVVFEGSGGPIGHGTVSRGFDCAPPPEPETLFLIGMPFASVL